MAETKVLPLNEPDVVDLHICDICGAAFSSQDKVKKHRKCHLEVKEEHTKCPKCWMTFKKYDTFWEHILLVHENDNPANPPPLPTAKPEQVKVPDDPAEVEALVKSMISPQNPKQCDRCLLAFCSPASAIRHVREVHLKLASSPRVECAVCSRTFVNNSVYNAHYRTVHSNLPPKKTPPPQETPDDSEHEDRTFSCSTCNLAFISREGLNRHLRNVHNMKDIPPEKKILVRPPPTTSTSSNPSHIVPQSLKCTECSKIFANWTALRDHNLTHQKARLEKCIKYMLKTVFGAICNSNLNCSMCGVSVSNSTEAKIHVYVKHPETYEDLVTSKAIQGSSVSCLHCDITKNTVEEMMDHVENEHPGKLPICGVCGHKELKERQMNDHYRMEHPGSSRYFCEVCKKRFDGKKSLERHMKGEHSGEGVQCPYCEEKHVKVKLHVTVKHPDKAEEYTKWKKMAIRKDQVERMKFNSFLEKGKIHQMTRKALEEAEEEDLEEEEEMVVKQEWGLAVESSEKVVVPEVYTLEKDNAVPHVIEVKRLPPPIQEEAVEEGVGEETFGDLMNQVEEGVVEEKANEIPKEAVLNLERLNEESIVGKRVTRSKRKSRDEQVQEDEELRPASPIARRTRRRR